MLMRVQSGVLGQVAKIASLLVFLAASAGCRHQNRCSSEPGCAAVGWQVFVLAQGDAAAASGSAAHFDRAGMPLAGACTASNSGVPRTCAFMVLSCTSEHFRGVHIHTCLR